MSTKYKTTHEVPTNALADRLDYLSSRLADGDTGEFIMSIPAELDYDADLVMNGAAIRLKKLEEENAELKEINDSIAEQYGKAVSHNLKMNTENAEMKARIKTILEKVEEQAQDKDLWFITKTAPEAYLMRALRELHSIIEMEVEDE